MSLVGPTQSEPGNISYILYVHKKDPQSFMFDEVWARRRACGEYFQKPYIQSLSKKIEYLIEGPPRIEVYLKIPR